MRRPGVVFSRLVPGLALVLLCACANQSYFSYPVDDLPPIQVGEGELTADAALSLTETPDLLALDDDMRTFVKQYVTGSQRQRLQNLHRTLRSPAIVGIDYDPYADGTARDVFHSGAANCLSYAHLFIAMARYAGLDARYMSLSLRPEWSRHGEQVALRKHVNVVVRLRNGEEYMVDIDPVPRERVASARELRDKEAAALYHSNRAMDALFLQDRSRAYAESVRSLSLGGNIDYLWVNLGAIYRGADQDTAAEAMYRRALSLNPRSPTAMNNLAVLYHSRGELEESRRWEDRVRKRRDQNPFYHYYLGEQAEADGDNDRALGHYLDAIDLQQTEAEFYFRVARLYLSMQRREESRVYAEKAVFHSRLVGERKEYKMFLDQLDRGTVVTASIDPN
ncbi:MAG: tetratricopeptide repeat protein [Halieaceae bacterium]|nr:tetratricopeptide repeat protein [Halieaceae bacterium]